MRNSNNNKKKEINYGQVYEKVLTDKSPFGVKEAYSSVRANLLFMSDPEGCTIIAVTGAAENTGKTLSCINVARSFARMGKRVLIIDADMRNPSVNKGLGIKLGTGLSEILAKITKEYHITPTDMDNLSILMAGATPPNPAELLYSNRFDELLRACETDYDYIFIDTPPVNVVSDALMISKKVKRYLFVVRAGIDTTQSVKMATESIKKVEGTILGCLLNDVNAKTQGAAGYYGGYGKYGRYGYGKYGKYGKYNQKSKYEQEYVNEDNDGEQRGI